jgi:hypothetical protein
MRERNKTWRSLRSHSIRDLLFALEAAFWLIVMRTLIVLLPFRLIAPRLGALAMESPAELTNSEAQTAQRVSWAVQSVARRLSLVCLPQAMAAKAMLRMRHIASTLYLGAHITPQSKIAAHAWLRCGPLIVTGKAGVRTNAPVACFGDNR